ncbi:AraC family transcriptional regulator [Chitinophaga pendula]|uniref:AraC family transcriptional regulator n=1 Tax=Chitinophaga TaxID=79328 RepID=UPI000BAE85D0|nr:MULTISPECIES: AraC family transcriptional regulator [Chitinophaga]ASZ13652.1 hypothetical protein CK934_23210 [Chitinophaga sp. MD30]UCJ08723.1 AraC family transcriptional regulator [Chitinophaga pendula]
MKIHVVTTSDVQYLPAIHSPERIRHFIPQATRTTIQGDFGNIYCQQSHLDLLTLSYCVFDLSRATDINISAFKSLHLCYNLSGRNIPVQQLVQLGNTQTLINYLICPQYTISLLPGHYSVLTLEVDQTLYPLLKEEYDFLRQLSPSQQLHSRCPRLTQSAQMQLTSEQLLSIEESGQLGSINLDAAAKRLLFLTFKEARTRLTSTIRLPCNPYKNLLLEVQHFIQHHLDHKMTIDSIARKFKLSRSRLQSAFKELFGIPIHSYIIEERIAKAKILLQQGALLAEVATTVGFPDKSNFVRAFKKATGLTPASYRELYNEEESNPS